jgi:hypothetical protein
MAISKRQNPEKHQNNKQIEKFQPIFAKWKVNGGVVTGNKAKREPVPENAELADSFFLFVIWGWKERGS